MTGEFGPNSDQVARFIEAAEALEYEHVAEIVGGQHEQDARDARDRVRRAPRSAARHSAIESAARAVLSTVLQRFPESTSTAERLQRVGFGTMLNTAVHALAARPGLDDETVGVVVDPFAAPIGFEWRSWGVRAEAEEHDCD